jgi:hypothetical protein
VERVRRLQNTANAWIPSTNHTAAAHLFAILNALILTQTLSVYVMLPRWYRPALGDDGAGNVAGGDEDGNSQDGVTISLAERMLGPEPDLLPGSEDAISLNAGQVDDADRFGGVVGSDGGGRVRSWSDYQQVQAQEHEEMQEENGRIAELERELASREHELADNRLVVAELCARLKAASALVPEAKRAELVAKTFLDSPSHSSLAAAGASEAREAGVWMEKKAATIGLSRKRYFTLTPARDTATARFRYFESRDQVTGGGVKFKGEIILQPSTTEISIAKEMLSIHTPERKWVRFFLFDRFTPEDAIEFHAFAPLEASRRVTNGIPLGCPLFLPVHTVNCVKTLKVLRAETELLAELWGGYLQTEVDKSRRREDVWLTPEGFGQWGVATTGSESGSSG